MTPSLLTAPSHEVDKAASAATVLPVVEAAATAKAADEAAGRRPQRPPFIPEEFWEDETGEVRLEALAQAYQALADRLSQSQAPASPDDYAITAGHPLLASDPDLNATLHEAGFSPQQAQLVYDLAAERVLPVIETLASEFEADRQLVRLVDHFGGEERWQEVSRQLLSWGKANLPPEVLHALSTTYEGVLALHRMMDGGETAGLEADAPPDFRSPTPAAMGGMDEDGLKSLMRDPRYWRDRDPVVMRRVTDGFRRLYPGEDQP